MDLLPRIHIAAECSSEKNIVQDKVCFQRSQIQEEYIRSLLCLPNMISMCVFVVHGTDSDGMLDWQQLRELG